MNILAIDTSTNSGSVSFKSGDTILTFSGDEKVSYSIRLFRWFSNIKEKLGDDTFSNLDAIAVASGPGSFTGLRVGLAAAKGIAMAAECSILPFPTLELMSRTAGEGPALRRPLLNAGRGEIYSALHRFENGALEIIEKEMVVHPEKIRLKSLDEPVFLFGTGLTILKPYLAAISDKSLFIKDFHPILTVEMISLAAEEITKSPRDKKERVKINYIRKPTTL